MYYGFCIEMNKKDIKAEELRAEYANEGMLFLLKNHYVEMSDYYEIEVNKLIKALKNLGQNYSVEYENSSYNNLNSSKTNGVFKFYLPLLKK
jgi:hypothetical protein